mmetsp:Transcript_19444/g.14114  ORF Transcript_19444/g.14114 Transcript_19444/m.14114 type:complete len:138 (-) Transcript_19444:149-562(-)
MTCLVIKKTDQKLRRHSRNSDIIGAGEGISATNEDSVARLLLAKFMTPKTLCRYAGWKISGMRRYFRLHTADIPNFARNVLTRKTCQWLPEQIHKATLMAERALKTYSAFVVPTFVATIPDIESPRASKILERKISV